MENHRKILIGGTKCIQTGANHCKSLFCTSLNWFPSLFCCLCKLSMIFHKNLMGNHRIPSLQALRILTLRQAQLGSAQLDSAQLSSAWLGSAWLSSARLSWARLSSAQLGSAHLGSAQLSSAHLSSSSSSAAAQEHPLRPRPPTPITARWLVSYFAHLLH